MDTISAQLATGNASALSIAKTLIAEPMLINPGFGYYENQLQLPFAIPLQTESHRQSISAEVSESLVICSDRKKNVADNIAPGPYTWTLSGYIPGDSLIEQTNLWTPIVKLRTDLLKMAASRGYLLIFKDIDNTIYKRVVITSLDIETQKDCRNATPFSMTLKQINVMSETELSETGSVIASIAEAGSSLGTAITSGVTVATSATVDIATLITS